MYIKPVVRSRYLPEINRKCLLLLLALVFYRAAAQVPPPLLAHAVKGNSLSSDWQVYDEAEKKLMPYIPQEHSENRAFYQHLTIRPDYPFEIAFPADKGLCIFLNNKLAFTVDSAADYTLDLSGIVLLPANKLVLLTVWSPDKQPDLAAFTTVTSPDSPKKITSGSFGNIVKIRSSSRQNVFIVFLLVIGLIYGTLRTNFSSDFHSVSRVGNFFRNAALEEGFLLKPIISWPGISFVLAFAIGFSVLVVAIQLSGLNAFIFNRFALFSNSDITGKILSNAFIVFAIILGRYVFLSLIAYIFSFSEMVSIQYREFLRGILFMGLFLPVLILFYLVFNQAHPETVSAITALTLVMLLTTIVLRVVFILNKKESILNLHLFSYICATEIIPLTVVLKLILFNN